MDFAWKTAWDLERLEPNTFFPVPASVVFATRVGDVRAVAPLAGEVERWLGKAGAPNVTRERVAITDTSVGGGSSYAGYSRQGAVIVPRCLFFVTETENPAIVRAGRTVTVNPRRGAQDKRPWRDLDLTAITQQTVGEGHLFDVHLGETLVPYATLDPLKAILPLKRTDASIPADGVSGIDIAGLEWRMRDRWRTVSRLWEENRAPVSKLDLRKQLDYYGKLSAQLGWRRDPGDRPVRVVYTKSGEPTAALLDDDMAIVDHLLYWVACKDAQEAYYLLAIINSDALREAVRPLMSKGQFGARDLHKHLWKLPIPEFDPGDPLHVAISRRRPGRRRRRRPRAGRAAPNPPPPHRNHRPPRAPQMAAGVGGREGGRRGGREASKLTH